jgi:hypothetical protein
LQAPVISPVLIVSGFGTFPQVPAGSIIFSVIAAIVWYESNAQAIAPSYELWDGTNSIIGIPQPGIASVTPGHIDLITFTGPVTYSQLATLQLRIYGISQAGNSGAAVNIDAASLSVSWTPNQNAAVHPVRIAVTDKVQAVTVTVSSSATVTPAPLAVSTAVPVATTGLLAAAIRPAAVRPAATVRTVSVSTGETVTPVTLGVIPAFPVSSEFVAAAIYPAAIRATTAVRAVKIHAGGTVTPGTVAASTSFPAVTTGFLAATTHPATIRATTMIRAVTVSTGETVTPGVLTAVPAFPAIIDPTIDYWATADSAPDGGWAMPVNATGPPDSTYSTWTVP